MYQINGLDHGYGKTTYRSVLFPHPATKSEAINPSSILAVREAYVSHGSTTVILLLSNLLICDFPRTILRFLCSVLSEQCGGLSKGPEERAKVGHPFEIGHLRSRFP